LGFPALEDVDAAGVELISSDGKVEAASCPTALFDDPLAARDVGIALPRFDGDVACHYDHG
jgi:hypothetical protein